MSELADKIKAANDVAKRAKPREIPEWGVTVYLKSFSGTDRKNLQTMAKDLAKTRGDESPLDTNFHIEICAKGLLDSQGTPIFNGDAASILIEKDATLVGELCDEILEHNGLGPKAQERAAKNLMSSQSYDSGTASLAT